MFGQRPVCNLHLSKVLLRSNKVFETEFPWTIRADSVPRTPSLRSWALLKTKMNSFLCRSTVNVSPALLVPFWAQTVPSTSLTSGLYLQVWAAITSGSGSMTGCLRGTSGGRTAARWWDTWLRQFDVGTKATAGITCYYLSANWRCGTTVKVSIYFKKGISKILPYYQTRSMASLLIII